MKHKSGCPKVYVVLVYADINYMEYKHDAGIEGVFINKKAAISKRLELKRRHGEGVSVHVLEFPLKGSVREIVTGVQNRAYFSHEQ